MTPNDIKIKDENIISHGCMNQLLFVKVTTTDARTKKDIWSFETFHWSLIILQLHSFISHKWKKKTTPRPQTSETEKEWGQCKRHPSVVLEILSINLSIWFYEQVNHGRNKAKTINIFIQSELRSET